MKLWIISQKVNNTYYTFDSAVVAAETAQRAREIHPVSLWRGRVATLEQEQSRGDWAPYDKVEVVEIGTALEGTKEGVLCASFNEG